MAWSKEYRRDYNKRRKASLRRNKLCYECGRVKAIGKCDSCKDKKRIRDRKRRELSHGQIRTVESTE